VTEHDRRHVLTAVTRIDALVAGENRVGLAEEDACDIKDVNAEVEDDEPLLVEEVRLWPMTPVSSTSRTRRSGV
jgi:hypothetical protein